MDLYGRMRGIITVESDSCNFERFINICRANRIIIYEIQQIQKEKQVVKSFKMYARDFKLLKPIVRKTNVRLKITDKCGIPFIIFRYRKHYCFIIGMVIAFMILYVSAMYVWKIEFEGNVELTDRTLLKYLNDINVSIGMPTNDVDCNLIEEKLRKQYNNITWASVELSGTKVIVHLKENDGYNKINATTECGDIISPYNGEIVSIVTRRGTPMVKKGDTVGSTDVLVSGEVFVYNDNKEIVGSYRVPADADIMIKTSILYQDSIDANYEYKLYSGRSKDYIRLSAFDKNIELEPDISDAFMSFDEFDESLDELQLKVNDSFYLPFKLGLGTRTEYVTEYGIYTMDEAKEILLDNLSFFLENLTKKGVQIIDTSVTIDGGAEALDDLNKYAMAGEITVICPANYAIRGCE